MVISPKDGLEKFLLDPWRVGTQREGGAKSSKKDDDMELDEDVEAEAADDAGLPGFHNGVIYVSYTQESLKNKRQRIARDRVGLLRQTEKIHVLSEQPLRLPERQRKHYPGTSCGDLIQGVIMPDPETQEKKITWGDKKKAFQKHIREVGSQVKGDGEPKAAPRKNDTLVPICFHSPPEAFYEELIHCFYAKLVVDMSCPDSKFAWTCLHERIGYCGIAYSEEHVAMLEKHLMEK